jgi:hypothetical protein
VGCWWRCLQVPGRYALVVVDTVGMLVGMNLGMALRFAVPAGLFAEAGLGQGSWGRVGGKVSCRRLVRARCPDKPQRGWLCGRSLAVGMELGHRLAMGADPWLMHGAMLVGMNLGMALRFAVPAVGLLLGGLAGVDALPGRGGICCARGQHEPFAKSSWPPAWSGQPTSGLRWWTSRDAWRQATRGLTLPDEEVTLGESRP